MGATLYEFDVARRVAELGRYDAGAPRGSAFEQLLDDLLAPIPGVDVVRRNALADFGDNEIDIQLTNDGRDGGLIGFPYDVLVECKTGGRSLKSRDLGWFATQMRRRQLGVGILASVASISGAKNERAAAQELRSSADEGRLIVVVYASELQLLHSVEHFAALLRDKRANGIARGRAIAYGPAAMRGIDPHRGGRLGSGAIRRIVIEERQRELYAMLDRLPHQQHDASAHARDTFQAVVEEGRRQIDDGESQDPFWTHARELMRDLGVAVAALADPVPLTGHDRRTMDFAVENDAPARVRANVGTELFELLGDYYLREIDQYHGAYRAERAVIALMRICVDNISDINNIDPTDVYGDENPG